MNVAQCVVYVAGPYRDPRGPWFIHRNIREAMDAAAELWSLGIPALCPHANTALMDGAAPDEVFLQGDLLMLARCDALLLLPRWRDSSGTRAEKEFAEARNLPVFHWPEDRERLIEFATHLPPTAPL